LHNLWNEPEPKGIENPFTEAVELNSYNYSQDSPFFSIKFFKYLYTSAINPNGQNKSFNGSIYDTNSTNEEDDNSSDISVGPSTIFVSPDLINTGSDFNKDIRNRVGWNTFSGSVSDPNVMDSADFKKTDSSAAKQKVSTLVLEPPGSGADPPGRDRGGDGFGRFHNFYFAKKPL
jgi:hypothetical protein